MNQKISFTYDILMIKVLITCWTRIWPTKIKSLDMLVSVDYLMNVSSHNIFHYHHGDLSEPLMKVWIRKPLHSCYFYDHNFENGFLNKYMSNKNKKSWNDGCDLFLNWYDLLQHLCYHHNDVIKSLIKVWIRKSILLCNFNVQNFDDLA